MISSPVLVNEKDLFMRLSQGDEAAFTEIFHHYTQRIYPYILQKTKSPETAEEIVQEVFIKIWNAREQFSDVKNYESFLFTMASNKLIDFFRRMSHQEKLKKEVWGTISDISNVTIEELDLRHSQRLIDEAVEQLSPQRKKIFLMSKKEGLSRQEIADRLGLSYRTVHNHLGEAITQVRTYLDNADGATLAVLLFIIQMVEWD